MSLWRSNRLSTQTEGCAPDRQAPRRRLRDLLRGRPQVLPVRHRHHRHPAPWRRAQGRLRRGEPARAAAGPRSRQVKWSEATVENVLERYGVDDAATIFRALVANRAAYVPGIAA